MKNLVIYQVFVRNFSIEGTFKKVEEDLERIKDLGTDIVYLMPIHEIGKLHRKGTWGSPYAIRDYFSISKDLGTMEDFISLVERTHKLGMKLILDMVFNHTSPDNVLVKSHPEYYFYKKGKRGNRVGDWSDIVDLATEKKEVQEYLVSVLKFWRSKGVDGFRFDVASMIPLSFYRKARKKLGKDVIFFAESIDPDFVNYLKEIKVPYVSDSEFYKVMDFQYNYNWFREMESYLKHKEYIYPMMKKIENDDPRLVRANCLENHDTERIASYFDNKDSLKDWIEFIYSLKGHAFIYAGQEYGIKKRPELFEKDPIVWEKDEEMFSFYKKLNKRKHLQKV